MWLLNLDNAKGLLDPSLIWSKAKNDLSRKYYDVVVGPNSRSDRSSCIWVIGGERVPTSEDTSDVLKISFKLSLKNLAIDCVARNLCDHDPRMRPNLLPRQLRSEIESYKSAVREKYVCIKCLMHIT